jgi:hypothetical protein
MPRRKGPGRPKLPRDRAGRIIRTKVAAKRAVAKPKFGGLKAIELSAGEAVKIAVGDVVLYLTAQVEKGGRKRSGPAPRASRAPTNVRRKAAARRPRRTRTEAEPIEPVHETPPEQTRTSEAPTGTGEPEIAAHPSTVASTDPESGDVGSEPDKPAPEPPKTDSDLDALLARISGDG